VNDYVKDRLVEVEKQNLSNNLLFFAIEETSGRKVVRDTETNGAQGGTNDKGNCVEVIYEFCEKNLIAKILFFNLYLSILYVIIHIFLSFHTLRYCFQINFN
jgi:hypothetical protein